MRSIARLTIAGALATSLAVAATSAPAGAATAAVCTKATFKTDLNKGTSTSQLTSCTKGPATAATLVANFKPKTGTQVKVTITWKSGGGKNGPFGITQKKVTKPNKCKFETVKGKKVQDSLIVSSAKITSGTGKAASLKGTTFSERLCITQKITTYLEPGSKVTI
jgi:hypothetical protein